LYLGELCAFIDLYSEERLTLEEAAGRVVRAARKVGAIVPSATKPGKTSDVKRLLNWRKRFDRKRPDSEEAHFARVGYNRIMESHEKLMTVVTNSSGTKIVDALLNAIWVRDMGKKVHSPPV